MSNPTPDTVEGPAVRALGDEEIDAIAGGMRFSHIPYAMMYAIGLVANAVGESVATIASGDCK